MKFDDKDILNVKEFAEYIRVHPNTVHNMIRKGYLAAFKTGNGKTCSYRIAKSEAQRMALIDLQELHKTLGKTQNE